MNAFMKVWWLAAGLVLATSCSDDKAQVADTHVTTTDAVATDAVDDVSTTTDSVEAGDGDGDGDAGADIDVVPPLPGAGIPWPGWDAGTVYFVIVDRFFDGNAANNRSYGRAPDGAGEVATFQGGDLAGLKQKVDAGYFLALGVSAIWITAPYEQIHGWVVAGNLKHYAYHGYYPLDFTTMDANFGTEAELEAFVDAAHSQGIRVVLDVVMNHAGYATPVDLNAYGVDVLKPGWENATPANLYDFIDFQDPDFGNWWGPKWVRAELGGGYPAPDNSDLTKTVDYLPDFLTESTQTGIGLPPFYAKKSDTQAVYRPELTVRGHLVEWLTSWVRRFGIDGFRCDTAKHVEQPAWKALKEAANAALVAWRAAHPEKAFPAGEYADVTKPFWMTGEVFPHGVTKDGYFDNGFDSLINFDFAGAAAAAIDNVLAIDATWADYAAKLNGDPAFDALSYISSHDTSLFFEKSAGKNLAKQKRAGALLLLTPGGVQIFYGDENARSYANVTDGAHRTRTAYAWGANPEVLAFWQKLGQFRKRHPAVGAGAHTKVSDAPYTFRRQKGDDVVLVALDASGTITVDVGGAFENGTVLRDAYTGATATVAAGKVTFTAGSDGVVLVERSD